MKYEYARKPARDIVPGDMIFNVKTRSPVAVDTVFVESNGKLVIEDVTGNTTAFGRKELVLVVK
ncbi:hypothetical protein [Salmonella enterica]|uniref:hypothetical protein n=1 Tax=Salmonella enterica TaxID=28901 RepID=UPI0010106557|nr:hypothetical protein [Salmonella enterica]RXO74402.1 hypothetical protein D6T58_23680 [Salmonella enterica subsp. enterica serovar Gallinarum]